MLLFQNCILLFLVLVSNPIRQQVTEPTIEISIPESITIGDSFKLTITINKNNINSFAKAQLNFPPGFIPEPIETENAKFFIEDKTVKLVWDKLPSKPELVICMIIKTKNATEGIKGISGIFAYLEGTIKKEKYIQSTIIKIESASMASNSKIKSRKPYSDLQNQHSSTTLENKNIKDHAAIENMEVISLDKTTEDLDPKDKLEYRIQIAAASNKIELKELAVKYNIEILLMEETHNGMFKYTVGPFATYNIARKQQSFYRITKGVNGAFITKYIDGNRIP